MYTSTSSIKLSLRLADRIGVGEGGGEEEEEPAPEVKEIGVNVEEPAHWRAETEMSKKMNRNNFKISNY